ncbi:MAG: SRPBCC domain-containing protein [Bryobacterales bacterium]|jgi:activator of HSP90 ATPase|nr:SRPBCC domain-containing protein [Bryobacterales bacterium]
MAKKTKTIRQTRGIPATPDQIYEALTNAKKHTAFTGAAATGAARVGGKFTAYDGYISGKHVVLDKGKRIVQQWQTTEWPEGEPPSTLEFILEAKGKGTSVKMIHSGIPADQAPRYGQGWDDYYWTPLKAHFTKA